MLSILAGIDILALAAAFIAYPPIYLPLLIAWKNSDAFDWQKFPANPLKAAPTPLYFEKGSDDRVIALFSRLSDTHRDLLMMSSGLEYKEFRFPGSNSDDPLTTYYPDQRRLALQNTMIIDPPGNYFLYNKYHPQLLGMILERTTGRSVTDYLQEKLWNPLGMEFSGSWSIDSEASDFEKMETGVNARAIDFAKFGQLFLKNGKWNGQQVISEGWVQVAAQVACHHPQWY